MPFKLNLLVDPKKGTLLYFDYTLVFACVVSESLNRADLLICGEHASRPSHVFISF
jgi:hypothetical protein